MDKPFVFLETTLPDTDNRHCFLFHDFKKILTFTSGQAPEVFFEKIQSELDRGNWACGFFEYEFGAFLEPSLAGIRTRTKRPLAWIGICEKPRRIAVFPGSRVCGPTRDYPAVACQNICPEESFGEYASKIRAIKDYLKRGWTYQINYTFPLRFRYAGNPLDLYLRLRQSQPTPYTAMIHTGKEVVLSFSPELFFRRNGRTVTVCPMKGTVRRGLTALQDGQNRLRILTDEKIRSENLMIVDLLRNDLGRISSKVWARRLFQAQKYRTLYQLVSTVKARLKKDARLGGLFTALFPSGSVTGAPKIKSMRIIHELEKRPRGVYTGAIGYMSKAADCFNVPIRTITLRGCQGTMGIGGGIVEGSDTKAEYEEALLKSEFLKAPFSNFYVFETIRWQRNRGYYLLNPHLERLKRSCDFFQICFRGPELLRLLKAAERRFRQLLKGVRLKVDVHGKVKLEEFAIVAQTEPVRICLNADRVDCSDLYLYHKTSQRQRYDQKRLQASKAGFFEQIFMNEKGQLTEGTITNLFVKIKGRLYTPPVACGLLPGVLRETLLKRRKAFEKILVRSDLKKAQEVYVGNSVRGLLRAEISL